MIRTWAEAIGGGGKDWIGIACRTYLSSEKVDRWGTRESGPVPEQYAESLVWRELLDGHSGELVPLVAQ